MFQIAAYEDIVRFASEGFLADELKRARAEYVARTGDMFESDAMFERRISAFLEWYVLDRPLSFEAGKTPADLYREQAPPSAVESLANLSNTTLSLFEFRRYKDEHMFVVDMFSGEKQAIFERRRPVGIEAKDVLEARIVPYDGKLTFSDSMVAHPREGRRAIVRGLKAFRKRGDTSASARIRMVHQVAYFANRCERYRHVNPKEIFVGLVKAAQEWAQAT